MLTFSTVNKEKITAATEATEYCCLDWIPADNTHINGFRNYGQYFVFVNVCPEERYQDKRK